MLLGDFEVILMRTYVSFNIIKVGAQICEGLDL